jgi:hypothetical protein
MSAREGQIIAGHRHDRPLRLLRGSVAQLTCGHTPFNATQRSLYAAALEQINYNVALLRPGMGFMEPIETGSAHPATLPGTPATASRCTASAWSTSGRSCPTTQRGPGL